MDKGVLIAIGISAISPILKSIFDFFLEKYKNRLSNYKYTQSLISLGATVNHDFLGKIEVYHNGCFKQFLTLATIEIKNAGTKEHSNFQVHISLDEKSEFMNSAAFYSGNGRAINLEPEHNRLLKSVNEQILIDNKFTKENPNYKTSLKVQEEYDYLKKNCIYLIPTILRGKAVKINLLIENKSGLSPVILPTIDFPGISLVEDRQDVVGDLVKRTNYNLSTSIVGFFIYIPAIFIIIKNFPESNLPITLIILVSSFYLQVSGVIVKLSKLIAKQLLS